MATTSRLSLRYPVASDTADVPRDIGNLASDIDKAAIFAKGTFAARPTSTVGSPGIDGRYYFATDTSRLYLDTGTSWVEVASGNDSVTNAMIATDAVDSDEIKAGAVDTAEIKDGAVTSAKILDGTIVNADVSVSAAIDQSKLAVPAWVEIGSSGNPAFKNSWTNFSASYASARYRKINDQVFVEGLIKSGTINAAAFTLPSGFRPPKRHVLASLSGTNSVAAFGRLDVNENGDVVPVSGGTDFFSVACTFSVTA